MQKNFDDGLWTWIREITSTVPQMPRPHDGQGPASRKTPTSWSGVSNEPSRACMAHPLALELDDLRPLKLGSGLDDGYHRLSSAPIPRCEAREPSTLMEAGVGGHRSRSRIARCGPAISTRRGNGCRCMRGTGSRSLPAINLHVRHVPLIKYEFMTRWESGHSELLPSLSSRARRIVQHQASASCLNGMSHPGQRELAA